MENLTPGDIDILIDALEAWETKDTMPSLFGHVITRILTEDAPEEVKRRLMQEEKEQKAKQEQDFRLKKESATLLKAKLIHMKHAMILSDANKIINPQSP